MLTTIFASAALLASATVVDALGSAVVKNNCPEAVSLANVPAAGGGQSEVQQSIQPGGSYSQQYTPLTNGQGWSMKLYKGTDMNNLVQWEYTCHNDGVIWFDLSAVNGDPFNGDWDLSATGGCNPKDTAYRYPTDDTYGMQSSCPDSSTVTVTLCGGSGGAQAPAPAPYPSGQAPSAPPAPEAPAPAPQPTYAPPSGPSPPENSPAAPQIPAPSVPAGGTYQGPGGPRVGPPGGDKIQGLQATTLATQVAGNTVTNVHTEVVTQVVTVSPVPAAPVKRHEHLHRHAHHHERF